MHHHTIHLLRTIGRQAVTVVAIVALMLSMLRMPCLLAVDQGSTPVEIAQVSAGSADSSGSPLGTNDPDGCGFCHCSVTAFCVIPDAVTRIPKSIDGRGAQRPVSSRVPDDLARTPDVPPDQA